MVNVCSCTHFSHARVCVCSLSRYPMLPGCWSLRGHSLSDHRTHKKALITVVFPHRLRVGQPSPNTLQSPTRRQHMTRLSLSTNTQETLRTSMVLCRCVNRLEVIFQSSLESQSQCCHMTGQLPHQQHSGSEASVT